MNRYEYALLTTAYLPPVDYFRVIARAANWKVERCEKYQKQSYRSRCHIMSANGPFTLTVPVDRSNGLSVPINEIKIDYSVSWQKNHWRTIESAYQSSPFYEYYKEDFRPFYEAETELLLDFNSALTSLILELLGIPGNISFTETYVKDTSQGDFRYLIHPKKSSPFEDINKKGRYHQVFAHKFDFVDNLSVLDLLFNEGPDSMRYLSY